MTPSYILFAGCRAQRSLYERYPSSLSPHIEGPHVPPRLRIEDRYSFSVITSPSYTTYTFYCKISSDGQGWCRRFDNNQTEPKTLGSGWSLSKPRHSSGTTACLVQQPTRISFMTHEAPDRVLSVVDTANHMLAVISAHRNRVKRFRMVLQRSINLAPVRMFHRLLTQEVCDSPTAGAHSNLLDPFL